MKKSLKLITTTVLFALSSSLFAATVVTVNGTKIDSSDIERRAKNIQNNSNGKIADSPQLRRYITNQLIVELVVSQEAKRLKLEKSNEYKANEAKILKQIKENGFDKQPNYKQNWADTQSQMLMMAYESYILNKNPITESQIQQRYNQIKSRYSGTDEVQLAEIVTNKKDDAQSAIKELNKKNKFADVAKKYSISPDTKNTGGVLAGYLSLVDIKDDNPIIYQAIANLNKGQFTKTPLQDGDINLILSINDKRKISIPSFEQLKTSLAQDLADEQLNKTVNNLLKQAKITPVK